MYEDIVPLKNKEFTDLKLSKSILNDKTILNCNVS